MQTFIFDKYNYVSLHLTQKLTRKQKETQHNYDVTFQWNLDSPAPDNSGQR